MNKYKIRTFESGNEDGATASGTIVLSIERSFTLDAGSLDEVEAKLRAEVREKKLAAGRVYQIIPQLEGADLARSIAISPEGAMKPVILDRASGLYAEFQRIRDVIQPAASETAARS